jgi:hypothetical protein
MKRIVLVVVLCFGVLVALVAQGSAAPRSGQTERAASAAAVTPQTAIAIVRGIVAKGLQCAYPGLHAVRYRAVVYSSEQVEVIVTVTRAGETLLVDIKFDVMSGGVVEANNLAAANILECAGPQEVPEGTPPKVRAFTKKGLTEPGKPGVVEFSVQDESGSARVYVNLYEGGTWKLRWSRKVAAKGLEHKRGAQLNFAADLVGPLRFCVFAENAAGLKSKSAPRSACALIALLANIKKVSNGCGGEGWAAVVAVENYFGNSSTYVDEATGNSYTVNFAAACNLHDAGYGGQTVRDKLHGNKPVNYQKWTRAQVDEKFRKDMVLLCKEKIPPEATSALDACMTNFRFDTVRTIGDRFFDADLNTPGIQETGSRSNE